MQKNKRQIVDSNKTSEDVLAELCLSTDKFGRFFFPHVFNKAENEITSQITNHIDNCLRVGKNKIVIAAPRGCGKTTKVLYGVIARRVAFKLSRLVVFVTNTATIAETQLESLKYEMSTSISMRELFGPLNPETISEVTNQFSRSTWIAYNRAMMFPRGAGQQLRGTNWRSHRPDLFVFDDLETREIAESDDQRKALRRWFFADALEAVSQYDRENAVFIYVDTLKHEDALVQYLLDDPAWSALRLEACDDEFNPTAPSFATKEQLLAKYAEYERAGEADSFFREMRNLPVSAKTALFKQTDFRFFAEEAGRFKPWTTDYTSARNEVVLGKRNPITLDGIVKYEKEKDWIRSSDLLTIILADPARTPQPTAAETAIIVLSLSLLNSAIYVREVDSDRIEPDEFYQKLEDKILMYRARILSVEETGLKSYITQPIENLLRKVNIPVQFVPIHSSTKKELRVKALSPYYRRHLVWHSEGQCTKLETQLKSYPYSKLKDVMDCLSFIIPLMDKEELMFQPEANEFDENVEQEFLELHMERDPYKYITEVFTI